MLEFGTGAYANNITRVTVHVLVLSGLLPSLVVLMHMHEPGCWGGQ